MLLLLTEKPKILPCQGNIDEFILSTLSNDNLVLRQSELLRVSQNQFGIFKVT